MKTANGASICKAKLPNASKDAKDFIKACLTNDDKKRPSAAELLKMKWIVEAKNQESQ